MASITFDGQSFIVDGRRLWLVGGTIQYARLCRDQWAGRIQAAKHAGLNTITTSVVWARHEGRAGQFDFTGDNDIRHFVQLIQQAGMHCILRVGPFVGGGFDFGGLPAWVPALKDVKLRTANQPFLEASSRFINAVAKQVRDLQVTVPQFPGDTHGGPIVLVQSEAGWTCGHDALAHGYLGELNRYIHESGFEVPIVNANNLWEGVEGEVDGWVGNRDLAAVVRQLSSVRPNQPRMVVEYDVSDAPVWGDEEPKGVSPDRLQRDLMSVLACAGQFNVEPFAGGTNFAFSGGRLPEGTSRFVATDPDEHAPLSAGGARGELYRPLRTVATFASRFGRVLSHLDARRPAIALHPGSASAPAKRGQPDAASHAVIHASGSQGSVAFIFAGRNMGDKPVDLLLGDGTSLPVWLGDQPTACCLVDVRLHGRSQLDYCNLSAFAQVGRVFVAYGPAGSQARLSINGSPLELEVPSGDTPSIVDHENILCVICTPAHLEKIQITDDAVLVGAVDVAGAGSPVVAGEKDVVLRLLTTGEVVKSRFGDKPVAPPPPPPPPKEEPKPKKPAPVKKGKKGVEPLPPPPPPPPAPRPPVVVRGMGVKAPRNPELSHWTSASTDDYTQGTSARYASIAGPAELSGLGAPYGYGWYRIALRSPANGKTDVLVPGGGDRLAFFIDGKPAGIMGLGAGARSELSLPLKRAEQTIVVLAENMGRFAGGAHMLDPKGVLDHLYEVKPVKLGRPTLERIESEAGGGINVLSVQAPIHGVHQGDVTEPQRVTFHVSKRRSRVVLRLKPGAYRGLIVINDVPLRYFDNSGPGSIVIEADKLAKSTNTVQLAVLGADPAQAVKDLAEAVEMLECMENVTQNGQWSFAKWERPPESAYHALRGHSHGKGPEWFRATFNGASVSAPLYLATTGLSKGQLYVNGRHIGRYFTATADGHAVGPQNELLIPPAALKADGVNEVVLFDEHGHLPSRAKLVYKM
ncbi:MAG TPA: beta-galactosidase [Phycisphaerales bacterium]|nr:beta-galactosidase [Phycisphaerales bacterium]